MRGRIVIIALAVVAVAVAFVSSREAAARSAPRARASAAALSHRRTRSALSFHYSPEKAKLLEPLIERFNARRALRRQARRFIDGRNIAPPARWRPGSRAAS